MAERKKFKLPKITPAQYRHGYGKPGGAVNLLSLAQSMLMMRYGGATYKEIANAHVEQYRSVMGFNWGPTDLRCRKITADLVDRYRRIGISVPKP